MDDDSYENDPSANRLPQFDDLAEPLGYLCFRYAQLEGNVNSFIVTFCGDSELARAIISHGGDNLDRRLTFVEQLIHLIDGLPQEYLDDVAAVSTAIKNCILPERNRLIHDDWAVGSGEMMEQLDLRISLKPHQAREAKTFNPIRRKPREKQHIWELAQSCYDAAGDLAILHSDLWRWVKDGEFHNTFGLNRRDKPRRYRRR